MSTGLIGKIGTEPYLQVPQLCELLAAVVEFAGEGLDLLMNDLVCTDVASLREGLSTDVAVIRPFAGVSPLMGL